MSSSDSFAEYVDSVNYCLTQARSLLLTETNSVDVSVASHAYRSPYSNGSGASVYGTSKIVTVSYVQPTFYTKGTIWLDCSPLRSGEMPMFKLCLTLPPAVSAWWPLDSVSSVYNSVLSMAQGMSATGASAANATFIREPLTVSSNGQTVFTLSSIPTLAALASFEVNGVSYNNPTAFTLSGAIMTWLNTFTLRTTDSVYAIYA